ncbi:uncharacterized protein LOC107885831, partial [Acyrthosiphon pisum]
MSKFYDELHTNRKNLAKNTNFLSDERYNELIEIILELTAGRKKKQPKDFRLIKRYDVLVVQGKTKLIFPVKDDNVVLYYVPNSELFDVLQTTHVSIGHGRRAKENLENQAKKMMAWSEKKLLPVAVHSTVRVPVPEVDKGRLDARSILAIVLEVTSDGFYRLGTRDGVLKQLYARSQFTVCQKKLLQIYEVPIDTEVALRTVSKEQSTGTGQGFLKCI